jgi:replicative DNA helicase
MTTSSAEILPMPHAVMSEKYLLSCMLNEPGRFIPRSAADGIDVDAFHLPGHRAMLKHLKEDYQKDGSFDLTVFIQRRNLDNTLDGMGGPSAVTDVFGYSCDSGGQWTQHAAIAREQKAMRVAFLMPSKVAEAQDSTQAIDEVKRTLEALQAAVAGPKRAATGRQAVDEFSDKLKADHAAGDYPGKQTGIHALDEIAGGMKPGEFWVVGGKPSDGKSVMLLQVGSAFIQRKEPVAIFSLEMMKHEIVGRLVSCMGRVDYGGITQPKKLSRSDLIKIQQTAATIAAAPLWIDASPGQSIETITAEAERIRDANGGLSLIVVDYLQLIRGGRGRNETREEEVARASGGLKQLAKAMNCPVLSASQLNEQGLVRESRAIAQDADAVLIIADDGVRILKMRNGVRDSILQLQLDGRFQRFTERHQ